VVFEKMLHPSIFLKGEPVAAGEGKKGVCGVATVEQPADDKCRLASARSLPTAMGVSV